MSASAKQITSRLNKILAAGQRPIGSEGIREVEAFIKGTLEQATGLELERQEFECYYWDIQGTTLLIGDKHLPALANTFSPSCDVSARTVSAGSLDDLDRIDLTGKIAILHGSLIAEPYAPKDFKFWNPEEHQLIIRLLEKKAPEAMICVSLREDHPVPVFEDWDLKIPSVTVPAAAGKTLIENIDCQAVVRIKSELKRTVSANVIAKTKLPAKKKIIICAHYDTKYGTVGAFDNATGVTALLSIAGIVSKQDLPVNVEFIAFAGEETYALGELEYLKRSSLENAILAINIDGIGLRSSANSIALFHTPSRITGAVSSLLEKYPQIVQVDPWPQGDHTLFWMRGIPCIAFSADLNNKEVLKKMHRISHTRLDTLEQVEPEKVSEVVNFIDELLCMKGIVNEG